mgnify:CR=1 FL=1
MSPIDHEALTLGGLFIAGLATTLHCAGMCGLLTCGLGIAGRGPSMGTVGVYHFCRLVGYAVAGLIAGTFGGLIGIEPDFAGVAWLPLLLIIFLLAISFGLDKKFAAIPGLGRIMTSLKVRTMRFPTIARAAIIGVATPLLPCGPLYAILGIAMASGSAIRGSETMLAFGLGAIPGIWAVQIGSAWVNQKLGAKGFLIAKRSLAAVAAISLAWHFSFIGSTQADNGSQEGPHCRCETGVK